MPTAPLSPNPVTITCTTDRFYSPSRTEVANSVLNARDPRQMQYVVLHILPTLLVAQQVARGSGRMRTIDAKAKM